MDNNAALTNEELAEIAHLYDHANTKPASHPQAFHHAAWKAVGECVPRLIAALRASRAEVKELRDKGYQTQAEWYRDYAQW